MFMYSRQVRICSSTSSTARQLTSCSDLGNDNEDNINGKGWSRTETGVMPFYCWLVGLDQQQTEVIQAFVLLITESHTQSA